MIKYSDLDLAVLVDLLSKELTEYTRMFANKEFDTPQYRQCKDTIGQLHIAIRAKKINQSTSSDFIEPAPGNDFIEPGPGQNP